MRILHISDVYPSPNSGAAGTDYQTVQALIDSGHDVEAIWADELSHHIKHYNLRYLLELPYAYRNAMLSRMRRKPFDIVQISQPHGYLAAKELIQCGTKTAFVHRSHGFESRVRDTLEHWRHQYPEVRPWFRQLASTLMARFLEHNNRLVTKYADGHLVSAKECADYIFSIYGVDHNRIGVIPQAVSGRFLKNSHPINAMRSRKILYVGQYAFVKAPMILGQVVSRLLRKFPDAEFTWVCAVQHHGEAKKHFSSDILSRIKLLDWMEQEKLIDVYDRHGVFLFPSFFEGFGKAFLEAMSRGMVVIAAKNGGMKDVISDSLDGFLVETGNIEDMTRAASGVMNDVDLATKLSYNAIIKAQAFSWNQYALNCSDFYESLLRLKSMKSIAKAD